LHFERYGRDCKIGNWEMSSDKRESLTGNRNESRFNKLDTEGVMFIERCKREAGAVNEARDKESDLYYKANDKSTD